MDKVEYENENIVKLPYKPGSKIWVIERNDPAGAGVEVCSYRFLSVIAQAIVVWPHSVDDIIDIVNYCIEETAKFYTCRLCMFPIKDCYKTKEEADAAFKKE